MRLSLRSALSSSPLYRCVATPWSDANVRMATNTEGLRRKMSSHYHNGHREGNSEHSGGSGNNNVAVGVKSIVKAVGELMRGSAAEAYVKPFLPSSSPSPALSSPFLTLYSLPTHSSPAPSSFASSHYSREDFFTLSMKALLLLDSLEIIAKKTHIHYMSANRLEDLLLRHAAVNSPLRLLVNLILSFNYNHFNAN